MSELGTAAAEAAAFTATGAAMAAADYGMTMMTAKATLYVRMIGMTLDTTGSGINEDVSGLRSLLKKRNKSSEKIAKRAGQSVNQASIVAEATMNKMSEVEMAAAMLSKGFIPTQVQYNPATLMLRTVGGKIRQYQAMGNENMNAMVSTDKKTSTYLSVQLIYEAIDNADAFGSSGLGMNVNDVVDATKSMLKNIDIGSQNSTLNKFMGGGYSVKKPVEGLLSLMMEKESRQIIFVWNNMFFHGELISANANFTMFNKLGNPIKATVNLEIQQSNGNALFASDRQYWNDAFDKVYGL